MHFPASGTARQKKPPFGTSGAGFCFQREMEIILPLLSHLFSNMIPAIGEKVKESGAFVTRS